MKGSWVSLKKLIFAASEPDSALKDNISDLEADFDYIIDGLDKLSRMGSAKEKDALSVSLELSEMLTDINNKISNLMIE